MVLGPMIATWRRRTMTTMIESHDYHLTLRSTGPKAGEFTGTEGEVPALAAASPPEFQGPGKTWSPEHLFVAAISGCLMTTFRAIAERSGVEVLEYSDAPSGRLARGEDGRYRMESVTLRPRVVVSDDDEVDKTVRLLHKAEEACLISRSVSAEVWMEERVQAATPMSRPS